MDAIGRLDGKVAIITGARPRAGRGRGPAVRGRGRQGACSPTCSTTRARPSAADARRRRRATATSTSPTRTSGSPRSPTAEDALRPGRRARQQRRHPRLQRRSTSRTSTSFRRVIDVNLIGAFLGMKTVVAVDDARPAAARSSTSRRTAASEGLPYLGAYSASKWAVRGLTKSAAIELGRQRHPRQLGAPRRHRHADDAVRGRRPDDAPFYKRLPLTRIGTVDEVAPWCCSSPPTRPATSPAPSTRSTAATWPATAPSTGGW